MQTLDASKFLKQGFVWKRGAFKRYNTKYHMCVEESYIRYGKIAKNKIHCIDLRQDAASIEVSADHKNNKHFKIDTPKKLIYLRCENP